MDILAIQSTDIQLVDQRIVVREWLSEEQSKPEATEFAIQSENKENEEEARLLAHKPDAARALIRFNYSWVKCQVPVSALGPVYTNWGEPSERRTVQQVAANLRTGSSELCSEKRQNIQMLIEDPPQSTAPFVITYLRSPLSQGSPFFLDGNHRAVAAYYRYRADKELGTQSIYLGYSGPCIQSTASLRRWFHYQLSRF